ncbi:YiiD C-terminal domain-containing protein [Clostridium aestuarii]|uniref:YiiD C-terminal domain-containing protein n=1 Tax=Clostridium aestuarii TaxID=338193 RepID=A0ABT4CVM9_9CLOT|nr:YiiD C-terminal domain-containing protein [Clostridium aestuarii]MCY6483031.1 YiiD C-terminal domain-containing protein [Clostridium aestuarii]
MTEKEFEKSLYNKIPLTKVMNFNVLEFTPYKVRISAKLEPNKNHMGIAFAGSINTLMTVCAWSISYINIKEIDANARLVLQKSSINYLVPIKNDFIAECVLLNDEDRNNFLKTYNEHGKAKLNLKVYCYDGENLAAKFEGKYVALKNI